MSFQRKTIMKQNIDNYIIAYRDYKKSIYKKLTVLIGIFIFPFIPTVVFYDVSLFIKILFWIFLSIMLILAIIFLAFMFFTTERPMYEFLYKDVIDDAFKEDTTHYEYEAFPKQYPFFNRGQLMTKTNSEVIRYRLTFYYSNNRIDLYSLYAYSNKSKSMEPSFNGMYYVIKHKNKNNYKYLSNEQFTDLSPNNKPSKSIIDIHQYLCDNLQTNVYISGIDNEIHIAINQSIDHLKPNQITQDKLIELSKNIWRLVKLGRKIYREIENTK